MAETEAHSIFRRWLDALSRLDYAALQELVHPEYVEEWPQSAERIRGFAAFRAVLEHYPGGVRPLALDDASARLVGDEERWVLTPGYTVLPLAGPGTYTTIFRNRYPDDSIWFILSVFQLRDGLMWRRTTYFAPEFEPPEWRRGFVELMPRGDRGDGPSSGIGE